MRNLVWVLLLSSVVGCRSRSEVAEPKAEAEEGISPLFQCQTVAQGEKQILGSLKITAQRPEHPRQKPNIFITIGNGARVRAHCGERNDLGRQSVFACWYSGGGLTVSWPDQEPKEESVVKVDRKRLFGAIGNVVQKLRCTREDTLEAVRQASL